MQRLCPAPAAQHLSRGSVLDPALALWHSPAVQVRRALPKTPKQEAVGDDPCTLYVRGLEADVDRDRLEAMFQVPAVSQSPPAAQA